MKDLSIMQGVKILGEFRFIRCDFYWEIFQLEKGAYRFKGWIQYVPRQSNIRLYEHAKKCVALLDENTKQKNKA